MNFYDRMGADTKYNFKYIMYDSNNHSTTYDFSFTTVQNLRITALLHLQLHLSANFVDYYNGQWYDGSSYDLQWRYNFSWSSPVESDLNKFELYFRKISDSYYRYFTIPINDEDLLKYKMVIQQIIHINLKWI